MVFLRENDRRHHFKTNVFMVILKESDTQHHFKNNLFKMYKKWQATKLVDLLQVDLLTSGASLFWPQSGRPRATKFARGPSPYEIRRRTFLKVYQTGSIWAKNVVIYNDDRRVELGTTTRAPRDTRTPDLAITIPWPCLISLQTTKWNQITGATGTAEGEGLVGPRPQHFFAPPPQLFALKK